MLISPTRSSALPPASASGKAMGWPLLKPWDSTSVMIMPMPIESTIVLLMSTSPRLAITFWKSGAETRLSTIEEATPASAPSSRLLPVRPRTTQMMYMEKTTTWG